MLLICVGAGFNTGKMQMYSEKNVEKFSLILIHCSIFLVEVSLVCL